MGIPFKIATYVFSEGTWIVIRGHVEQYAVGLTNGIEKLSVNGTLAVYSFQVVHPVNAFPLKNEISRTDAMRIRQHIDTIAKGNSFLGSIKKPWEVSIIVAANQKDFRICVKRTELFAGCNQLQLSYKVNTL